MTTAHSFAAYIEDKSHRKLLFWFLAGFVGLLLAIFEILSFVPPQVRAEGAPTTHALDQPFSVDFLGAVQENSLEVNIDPPIPYQTRWSRTTLLVERLEIIPSGILQAETNYSVDIEVKNWFGLTRKLSLQQKTSVFPSVIATDPTNEGFDVAAKTKIKFKLTNSLEKVDYIFYSNPPLNFDLQRDKTDLTIIPKNSLKQGQKYEISLLLTSATINPQTLYLGSFTTIEPLVLTSSTPANGASSISKFTSLSFNFNKPVERASLLTSWQIEPVTAGLFNWKDDLSFDFTPSEPLKSSTLYSIKLLGALQGIDGSSLEESQTVSFRSAGSVKVLSITPSGAYVSTSSTVSVNFDQTVDQASAQAHFSTAPNTSGSFSWVGNTMNFKPTSLAMLTTYKINLTSGIKSSGGEDSSQVFSGSFTTTSERIRTIGRSIQGRAINATYFGVGPKRILLVGCLHGSECNSGQLLAEWIGYLRANQDSIATDRTFIIVPYANPDGRAANQRFNAGGVDLNRNWEASWQPQTYWLNNTYPNGGGSAPFSEPETVTLRDLILSENPTRIVSYHSAASLVVGYGISTGFRDWYSSKTGYASGSGGVESFGYSITGTLEEWAINRGIDAIVVELATTGSSEFSRNLPALKDLLNSYPL